MDPFTRGIRSELLILDRWGSCLSLTSSPPTSPSVTTLQPLWLFSEVLFWPQALHLHNLAELSWSSYSHFLLRGNLPNPEIKPTSPVLAGRFFTTEPPGKASYDGICLYTFYMTTWMDLEGIVLNEMSNRVRQVLFDLTYAWNLKQSKQNPKLNDRTGQWLS